MPYQVYLDSTWHGVFTSPQPETPFHAVSLVPLHPIYITAKGWYGEKSICTMDTDGTPEHRCRFKAREKPTWWCVPFVVLHWRQKLHKKQSVHNQRLTTQRMSRSKSSAPNAKKQKHGRCAGNGSAGDHKEANALQQYFRRQVPHDSFCVHINHHPNFQRQLNTKKNKGHHAIATHPPTTLNTDRGRLN